MGPTITCDPDGDLRLKVGTKSYPKEQHEFIVCSKSLSRASRPFKKMLYGNFRESMKATSTTENWAVELPEDDPFGLKVLLHIIHSKYELVPSIVTLGYLDRILVVSDKYDMSHLIRPWANAWFQPLAKNVKATEYSLMLRVAWNLGADHVFKQVVKSICLEYTVDQQGEVDGLGLHGSNCMWPAIPLRTEFLEGLGALKAVRRVRREIIDQAVDLLKNCMTPMMGTNTQTYQCRRKDKLGAKACDIMTLGSMFRSLPAHIRDLMVVRMPTPIYCGSVDSLITIIERIEVVLFNESHQWCNPIPQIVQKIKLKMGDAETIVTKEHIEHLLIQKQKTGLVTEN